MAKETRQSDWQARLLHALELRDPQAVTAALDEVHMADLAELFPDLGETARLDVLDTLDDERAADLIGELDPERWPEVLDLLPLERALAILDAMPSDEAADLLGELPTSEADAYLARMEPELADDVAELMRYAEDTAGGLMAKEFVHVAPEQTVADTLAQLRAHPDDAEMIYYLYVIDEDERLLGVVTLRRLIINDPALTMTDIMTREYVSVAADLPQDAVAEAVRRHDLLAVPVIDTEGRMLGIITVDDIGDVVQEEAAEDLLELSGSEEAQDGVDRQRRWRMWRSGLLVLLGGMAASVLIRGFWPVLAGWRDIAALLPVLLVLAITTGSQSAVSMDNAYESDIERRQLWPIFLRELLTGATLALIGGALSGLFVGMLARNAAAGIATVLPVALGVWAAAAVGALGAVIFHRPGKRLSSAANAAILALAVVIALGAFLLAAYLGG